MKRRRTPVQTWIGKGFKSEEGAGEGGAEMRGDRRHGSVAEWVRANRLMIDAEILRQCPSLGTERLTDRERRLWTVNDEGLYRLARADGARV